MKKRTILMLLSVLVAAFFIAGCASDVGETGEHTDPDVNTPPIPAHAEEIVVETAYGDLFFPKQWEEFLQVDQTDGDNTVEVTFSAKIQENVIPLFSVLVGGDTGDVAGVLTADDGTQRNVYVKIAEIPENDALSQIEQQRIYAMQEDLKYLIDNLK